MFDLSSVESQGDEADCMYFIEDGEVRVTVKNQVNFCDPKTPPPPPKKNRNKNQEAYGPRRQPEQIDKIKST